MSDAPDFPVVAVWRPAGTAGWVKVGQLGSWSSLSFTPTFDDAGSWSLTMPYDLAATKILPDRLVTIDWRGVRTTWTVDTFIPAQTEDAGRPNLTVSGGSALSMLGREQIWPDATKTIELQPNYRTKDPAPYQGPAESVLRRLIVQNYRDRRGETVTFTADGARGGTLKLRPNFENLFEYVTTKAKSKGVGVTMGLINTTATAATLQVKFFTPRDLSARVRLTSQLGTIAAWEQTDTAPTATRVVVGVGDDGAARTTLARDVSAGSSQIKVASSKNFPTPDKNTPSFRIIIDAESLNVTAVGSKATTHLSSAVTASDKTIPVDSVDDFPDPPFAAAIGSESVTVTDINGKVLTVVRGVGSDKPSGHDNNVSVTADLSAYWTVTRGVGATTPASHDAGDRVALARRYKVVTTTAAQAAAATWGGDRVVYLAGPDTDDPDEIVDAGEATLSDGAENRSLLVTASEAEGLRAFTHFQVGDICTAEVETGASAVAPISAIAVTVDVDAGIVVQPVFGEPGTINSTLRLGTVVRAIGRLARKNERE